MKKVFCYHPAFSTGVFLLLCPLHLVVLFESKQAVPKVQVRGLSYQLFVNTLIKVKSKEGDYVKGEVEVEVDIEVEEEEALFANKHPVSKPRKKVFS